MRSTAALLLRDLLTKLHPPNPATGHESKRLLALLNTSFQKQLDDVHPPTTKRQSDLAQVPVLTGPSHHSHSHLDSVLHHPLLETERPNIPNIQNSPSNGPIEEFEACIRQGALTLPRLARILKQYRGTGSHEEHDERLGQRISAWLASESPSIKAAFFYDQNLLAEVLPIMYAEGLEGQVWSWLKGLYEREWAGGVQNLSADDAYLFLRSEDTLISEMMRMSIRKNHVHDAAVQFTQAAAYRQQTPNVGKGPLANAYKRISSTILHRKHQHGIEPPTFDELLRVSDPFRHHVIMPNILHLYHPTKATAEGLQNDLDDEAFVEKWMSSHSKSRKLHHALLGSILDAAQLCLAQHQSSSARFFLNFAGSHWPKYLPQKVSSEDVSLLSRILQARKDAEISTTVRHIQLEPS